MNEMLLKKTVKNDQSGQALVEYVLLLAVTIALILGLANQVYKPFGNWLQDYMGAYLECLIDIGELPSLGYDASSGECNSKFQPATAANGRPPKPGESTSNSGRRSGSGNSDENGSGGGSVAGGGRRSGSQSRGFPVGSKAGADSTASTSNSAVITEKLPESNYFRLRSSGYTVAGSQTRIGANGIQGIITVEQKKIEKRGQKAFTAGRLQEGDSNNQRAKKLVVKPAERKAASEEPNPSWSFSEYLKFGLIFLIIVAIILFLGGQILQISKSMEK